MSATYSSNLGAVDLDVASACITLDTRGLDKLRLQADLESGTWNGAVLQLQGRTAFGRGAWEDIDDANGVLSAEGITEVCDIAAYGEVRAVVDTVSGTAGSRATLFLFAVSSTFRTHGAESHSSLAIDGAGAGIQVNAIGRSFVRAQAALIDGAWNGGELAVQGRLGLGMGQWYDINDAGGSLLADGQTVACDARVYAELRLVVKTKSGTAGSTALVALNALSASGFSGLSGPVDFYAAASSGGAVNVHHELVIERGVIVSWLVNGVSIG